jgi:hypothetical protein
VVKAETEIVVVRQDRENFSVMHYSVVMPLDTTICGMRYDGEQREAIKHFKEVVAEVAM